MKPRTIEKDSLDLVFYYFGYLKFFTLNHELKNRVKSWIKEKLPEFVTDVIIKVSIFLKIVKF